MSHSTTSLRGVSGTWGSPGEKSIRRCDDLSACGASSRSLPPRSSRTPKCPRSSLRPLCSSERPPALHSVTCCSCLWPVALGRSPGGLHIRPMLAELEAWGSRPPPLGGPLSRTVGAAGETFPSSTLGAPFACFWGRVPAGPNQRQAAQARPSYRFGP